MAAAQKFRRLLCLISGGQQELTKAARLASVTPVFPQVAVLTLGFRRVLEAARKRSVRPEGNRKTAQTVLTD